MKKSVLTLIGLVAIAAGTLAGCKSSSKKKKGPEPSEGAWTGAFNTAVYVGNNAASYEGNNDVKPDEQTPAPFVALAISNSVRPMGETDDYAFTYKYKYKVTVNGEEKNADDYVEAEIESQAFNQKVVQFKGWPAIGDNNMDAYPHFTVEATAKCNGWSQTKEYTMVLNPAQYEYKKKSFSDIYAKHSSLNALSFMRQKGGTTNGYECDGEGTSTYYNVETQGKLVYATTDGNWGILQDGNRYIQLYRLDALTIWEKIKDSLIGKNIWIKGNLSFGFGNVQIGNIKSILPIKDGDSEHPVQAPASDATFNEGTFTNHEWWNNPVFNTIGFAGSGTVTDGKIWAVVNQGSGNPSTRVQVSKDSVQAYSSRYEFDVTIGSTTVVVATDYHVSCGLNGKNEVGENNQQFTDWIKGIEAGKSVKVAGTLRWLNDRSISDGGNDYTIYTDGVWTVTPFLLDHIQ